MGPTMKEGLTYHAKCTMHRRFSANHRQVVLIEPEEDADSLDFPIPGNVHTPVEVFVGAVIKASGQEGTTHQGDAPHKKSRRNEGNLADNDQGRSIPPGHWHGVAVLLAEQVVGFVCPENSMVDQRVPLERIIEYASGPVHHIPMERPFETGVKDDCEDEPHQQP